jgi:hypothetical protein
VLLGLDTLLDLSDEDPDQTLLSAPGEWDAEIESTTDASFTGSPRLFGDAKQGVTGKGSGG